jgi:hypothetical protein
MMQVLQQQSRALAMANGASGMSRSKRIAASRSINARSSVLRASSQLPSWPAVVEGRPSRVVCYSTASAIHPAAKLQAPGQHLEQVRTIAANATRGDLPRCGRRFAAFHSLAPVAGPIGAKCPARDRWIDGNMISAVAAALADGGR